MTILASVQEAEYPVYQVAVTSDFHYTESPNTGTEQALSFYVSSVNEGTSGLFAAVLEGIKTAAENFSWPSAPAGTDGTVISSFGSIQVTEATAPGTEVTQDVSPA